MASEPYPLEVEGGKEEPPDHPDHRESHDGVAHGEVARAGEDAWRHERGLRPPLDGPEGGHERRGGYEEEDGEGRRVGRGPDDGVDGGDDGGRNEESAGQVEAAAPAVVARLGIGVQERATQGERRQADGHVDKEDPGPTEGLREDAAEEDAHGRAAGDDEGPDAHGAGAVGGLGEGGDDDRQRRRGGDGPTYPLQRPRRN